MDLHVKEQSYKVNRDDRNKMKGHSSFVIWFTGLSGSGKSSIANALELDLHKKNIHTYSLDGDNVRLGLNQDLDFTDEGRKENIRRIGEVAKLMNDAGLIVTCAFVSPFREDRTIAKNIIGAENFIEVFVDCPLEVCEQRDVKGLYAKARKGVIKNFTGIDSPFEAPKSPDVHLKTDESDITACIEQIWAKIQEKNKITHEV